MIRMVSEHPVAAATRVCIQCCRLHRARRVLQAIAVASSAQPALCLCIDAVHAQQAALPGCNGWSPCLSYAPKRSYTEKVLAELLGRNLLTASDTSFQKNSIRVAPILVGKTALLSKAHTQEVSPSHRTRHEGLQSGEWLERAAGLCYCVFLRRVLKDHAVST